MFEGHQILRRLKLNLGAHSFGYLINILNQLALLPVYLHFWPKAIYGEWLVLSALPVYVEMADFGLGIIASNRMCMASAKGDHDSATRVLHTTWAFQTGVLAFVLLALTGIIGWGDPSAWLGIHNLEPFDVKVVLFLLMTRSLIPCQLRIYAAIYASEFQAARSVFLQNAVRVVDLVVSIIMIVMGGGVIGVAAGMLTVYVLAMAYMQIDMHWAHLRYKLGWSGFSMEELKGCLRDGFAFQLIPTSGMFLMQGMTIVVNLALGPAAVVVYSITRVVCRISLAGVQLSSWAIRPELALLYGRGDLPRVKRIFELLVKLAFWISTAACLGVLLLGHWAIILLSYGKVEASGWFLVCFALTMVTSGFWNGASILLVAVNRHRNFAVMAFILTLLLLPLSWCLMRVLGLVGGPLGVLMVDLAICAYTWRECCRVFAKAAPVSLLDTLRFPDRAMYAQLFGSRHSSEFNQGTDSDKKEIISDDNSGGNMETTFNSEPLVSIIIDNYNYGDFVGEAIRSALEQTYPHIEVIVVDDGSTDHSRATIDSFQDPRIKKVYQENGGQAAAFNSGFSLSSGEIVFTLDSDDYLLPYAVEKVVGLYRPGVAGFHFRLKMEDDKKNPLGFCPVWNRPLASGRCDELLMKHGTYISPPMSGKAFVRECMAKFMPAPAVQFRQGADFYFYSSIAFFGEIVAIEEPLAVWRQHGRGYHLKRAMRTDYAQAVKQMKFLHTCQEALQEMGRKNNIAIPDDLMLRDGIYMRYRVLAWKLRPTAEPVPPGETFVDVLRASWRCVTTYAHYDRRKHLADIIWFSLSFPMPTRFLDYSQRIFGALKQYGEPNK